MEDDLGKAVDTYIEKLMAETGELKGIIDNLRKMPANGTSIININIP